MKKKWKHLLRRAGSAILTLLLLVAMVGVMTVEAAGVTIALHYHRPDGAYDGWDVWAWGEGKDGAAYPLTDVDGEMVATIPVDPGVSRVGFIVRSGGDSWSAKDIDADQFIELGDVVSGTLHVYVESGVEGYTQEAGDDVATGVLVSGARYDQDSGTVAVTTTGAVDGDLIAAFQIQGPDGAVGITAADQTGDGAYALTPEAALDITKTYQLIFEEMEYPITMPNIYSTDSFEAEYTYEGDDLGATWTAEKTTFRVWAPTADAVSVNLYESGTAGTDDLLEQLPMTPDVNGTWVAEKEGDLSGTYYTYTAQFGDELHEAVDPYARTTGVNGQRAMVIDLDSTDPEGWDTDANPNAGQSYNDAIIYELHVRDLSSDESAGIENKGKFLGLTETGTTTPGGVATGLDHIKALGVTHVHLLPSYDFGSVDESRLDEPQFNWGYDPVNYNVPEGSYSTDPYHGEVRVSEMKQMVQALHQNGLSVVMDVVYNHVQSAEDFCFNQIVPGYFSRISENGSYSNGSGCGNDTASERSMVRKYIVDSVKYWADEYHIDGFRFDLVGLLDVETINEIVETVHADHPDVIFYGEGWSMATDVTKEGVELATQANSELTPGFAYFNDTIRDAMKGSVFDKNPGFVSGDVAKSADIERCFTGMPLWSSTPAQTVNYASCHDNNTLLDRITLSVPDASRADIVRMNNLAAAIYMTSEGIPFMQAGEEMLRTKVNPDGSFNENSYNATDEVNSLKWSTLEEEEYQNVFAYYQGLIAFRKAHPALRLTNAADVEANVSAVKDLPNGVVAFEIAGGAGGDSADGMYLIFNSTAETQTLTLPAGTWDVYVNGEQAGTEVLDTIAAGTADVSPISALVLVRQTGSASAEAETETTPATDASEAETTQSEAASAEAAADTTQSESASAETTPDADSDESAQGGSGGLIAVIIIAVVAVAAIVGFIFYRKKKKA